MQISAANNTGIPVSTTAKSQAVDPKADDKLKAACKGFEAIFLNMMLTEMRQTVPKDSLMGESDNQQDITQSMLDSEMTKNMSQSGGVGLADMLYRQLSPPTAPAVNKDLTAK